jgi:hypothetical protein
MHVPLFQAEAGRRLGGSRVGEVFFAGLRLLPYGYRPGKPASSWRSRHVSVLAVLFLASKISRLVLLFVHISVY